MNEEKRQALAQLLIGVTKKEWEFVRDRIDTEFASAAHKAVLLGDAEAIVKAMKDTWNED